MKIDRSLNFVLPVEIETGVLYVHQAPILMETFQRYYRVLAETFGEIMASGPAMQLASPKVSALILRDVATRLDVWDSVPANPALGRPAFDGVEHGLVKEIRRLSNVIALDGDRGWRTTPVEEALKRGLLSEEDWAEVEGVCVFFIVVSAMQQRRLVRGHLEMSAPVWRAQVTYSTPMEFAGSLPTSMPEEPTDETRKQ